MAASTTRREASMVSFRAGTSFSKSKAAATSDLSMTGRLSSNKQSVTRKRNGKDEDKEKDDQWQSILSAKDDELVDLQRQLEDQTRRANMAESELSLALASMARAEEAHGTELARAESDAVQAVAERREVVNRLQLIEVVEEAVRDLYIQVKWRVAEQSARPSASELAAERAALKEDNILVVLGRLHATIKNIRDFKGVAEAAMKGQQQGREAEWQARLQGTTSQLRSLESQLMEQQEQAASELQAARNGLRQRDAELAERDALLQEMQDKHAELLQALAEAEDRSKQMQDAMTSALAEGKRRDALVLRNKQLESARHFDRLGFDKELRDMQLQHRREMEAIQREMGSMGAVLRENTQVKEQLAGALQVITSLKKNVTAQRLVELEATVQRLTEVAHSREAAEKSLRGKLNKLRGKLAAEDVEEGRSSWLYAGACISGPQATPAVEDDPTVGVLANVHSMHDTARSSLDALKKKLAAPELNRVLVSASEDAGIQGMRRQASAAPRAVRAVRPSTAGASRGAGVVGTVEAASSRTSYQRPTRPMSAMARS